MKMKKQLKLRAGQIGKKQTKKKISISKWQVTNYKWQMANKKKKVEQNCDKIYLTVPLKSTGSCGMTEMAERSASRPTPRMSTPSRVMLPASNSVRRSRPRNRELADRVK
jgi:hypothetical protein